MARLTGIILLLGVLFFFWNREKIDFWKQRVIEAVNPAVKEKRLIGELEENLSKILGLTDAASSLSSAEKQKAVSNFLRQAQETIGELKKTNQKADLGANLSNLIQKFSPFSEKAEPTWIPPAVCP